jgi:hypothetical protein
MPGRWRNSSVAAGALRLTTPCAEIRLPRDESGMAVACNTQDTPKTEEKPSQQTEPDDLRAMVLVLQCASPLECGTSGTTDRYFEFEEYLE